MVFRPVAIKAGSAATFQNGMLVLTPVGDNGTKTDFFKEYTNNLLPGDNLTFAITLKNDSSERVNFYFWASDSDFANNENKKEMSDVLLSLIRLKIEMPDNTLLYEGPASGKGDSHIGASKIIGTGRADGIPLGWIESNSSKKMNITIQVPRDLGNEFQAAFAAVDWTFLCEVYEAPTPTTTPTNPPEGTPTPTPVTPIVTPSITPMPTPIEEEEVIDEVIDTIVDVNGEESEDDIPEGIIIIDDTNLGKLPQTGTLASISGNSNKISSVVFLLLVVCFILSFVKYKMKNSSN